MKKQREKLIKIKKYFKLDCFILLKNSHSKIDFFFSKIFFIYY